MGQEASVSMRCPPHHTHPASITTKLRRFLRKRRRFSKFSPTFLGKSPTFFFFSPTFLRLLARFYLSLPSRFCPSPSSRFSLPFSLYERALSRARVHAHPANDLGATFSECYALSRARVHAHPAVLYFLLSQPSQILS